MNEQLTEQVHALFAEEKLKGTFEERLDALIEHRTSIFAALAPYVRSSTLSRWRSAFLQAEHERTTRILRQDLRRWLPEIESMPSEIEDAVELMLSFEAWNRLRVEQRLGIRRTASVLRISIQALTTSHRHA